MTFLHKLLRWAVALLLAMAAGLGASVLIYDRRVFTPYKQLARSLIDHASSEERQIPPRVSDLIESIVPSEATIIARRLPWLGPELSAHETHTDAVWQAILFPPLLQLHFSRQDLTTLYVATMPNGTDTVGMEKGAEAYFGKPISQLNSDQILELLAIEANPSIVRDPKRLESKIEYLRRRANIQR